MNRDAEAGPSGAAEGKTDVAEEATVVPVDQTKLVENPTDKPVAVRNKSVLNW